MKQLTRVLTSIAVLLVSLVALAAVHALPAGLAVVTVPDDWTVRIEENHLVAVSRDEAVTLLLQDSKAMDVKPPLPQPFVGVDEFQPEGEPERLRFNGFTGFIQRGKGRVDGKSVAAEEIHLTHRLRKFIVTGWAYGEDKKYTRERRDRTRRIVRSLRAME